MKEKFKRNEALWEYHIKHPNTGSTKMGRVFKISPSAVWRILNRMGKRQDKPVEIDTTKDGD